MLFFVQKYEWNSAFFKLSLIMEQRAQLDGKMSLCIMLLKSVYSKNKYFDEQKCIFGHCRKAILINSIYTCLLKIVVSNFLDLPTLGLFLYCVKMCVPLCFLKRETKQLNNKKLQLKTLKRVTSKNNQSSLSTYYNNPFIRKEFLCRINKIYYWR